MLRVWYPYGLNLNAFKGKADMIDLDKREFHNEPVLILCRST